jgi:hypothetical protein
MIFTSLLDVTAASIILGSIDLGGGFEANLVRTR